MCTLQVFPSAGTQRLGQQAEVEGMTEAGERGTRLAEEEETETPWLCI